MKLVTPAPATPAAELARLQWTIAIVAGATLPHWPTLPLWVPVLLGVAIAWRLAIAALEWPVPIRTLRLLLALAAFCAVLFSVSHDQRRRSRQRAARRDDRAEVPRVEAATATSSC